MSEQIETKDCPYCGEKINAKAIKCKHCQSMLNSNESKATKECPSCAEIVNASDAKCVHCQSDLSRSAPVVAQVSFNKGAKLEAIVTEHQKKHRLAHPLPQKDQPKQGGIMGFIKKSIADMKGPSEVAFMDEITPAILVGHGKYAKGLTSQSEKPLLVINTTFADAGSGVGTGAVLTTHNLYYSLRPAKMSLIGGFGLADIVGCMPVKDIQALSIGSSSNGYGGAYNGHEFFLNGQKLGLLRMGTGACWDDEALECSQELSGKLTAEVFSLK